MPKKCKFQYPLNLHCSQTYFSYTRQRPSFNTLWIYTALKLECSNGLFTKCFNTLWIYTALKQDVVVKVTLTGFNTLWIYTALKLLLVIIVRSEVSIPSEFTLLSNHTEHNAKQTKFQYPLNLHCSQTNLVFYTSNIGFNTLWIYTALKHTLVA